MSWGVFQSSAGPVHVVPINDLFTHTLDDNCPCKLHINSDGVRIHDSYDAREYKEHDYQGPRVSNEGEYDA